MTFPVDTFFTFNIAILVLFLGQYVSKKSVYLRRFSIPDPLAGGLICALVLALVNVLLNVKVTFATEPRDFFLVYFFAAIGLRANIMDLVSGGKPLAILIAVSTVFLILQNLTGMTAATVFGLDPLIGLVSGSVSLVGGVGTTVAWAPIFEDQLGLTGAQEIGIACNTVGMIAACLIGGPIAQRLMYRHKIAGSNDRDLEVGALEGESRGPALHYYDVLKGIFSINMVCAIGFALHLSLTEAGVVVPLFVPVLVCGILYNNIGQLLAPKVSRAGRNRGVALISDISLGIFLSMALMSMDLLTVWASIDYVAFVMALQILLAILYAYFIVFRAMGRDYDATVVSAGFGGIALGSTATAVLNMTQVVQRFGASHKAFLIVPLTCGFFIDLANSAIIGWFAGV
ncbi:sodium/glutamate symporter [Pseudovibrio flavus]|uniref:sodium/glutamate symporter n=1 Tax=Pseudovibrio flavus TaxID=2529854 RepID=UPI003526DCCC